MGETFYKRMFLVGALWNLLGGVFIVVFADRVFAASNVTPPQPPLYFHAWIALFVTFGIGYYMVFQDLYTNKNIVILGIIGKLAFSAIFIYNMLAFRAEIPSFYLIPVVGDLIFVVLFAMFLHFARKTRREVDA